MTREFLKPETRVEEHKASISLCCLSVMVSFIIHDHGCGCR